MVFVGKISVIINVVAALGSLFSEVYNICFLRAVRRALFKHTANYDQLTGFLFYITIPNLKSPHRHVIFYSSYFRVHHSLAITGRSFISQYVHKFVLFVQLVEHAQKLIKISNLNLVDYIANSRRSTMSGNNYYNTNGQCFGRHQSHQQMKSHVIRTLFPQLTTTLILNSLFGQ